MGERLERPVEFFAEEPWQARERAFDDGEVDLAWLCGLPYVRRRDAGKGPRLLAAPVMSDLRYADRPVYFSDVIVRWSSPWRSLGDLRGKRWAYSEPGSHSGYNVTRCELRRAGFADGFFGEVIGAGSHQAAVTMLLRGEIDATALDSTVLEGLCWQSPELREQLRVVVTWGPSPMPPWVCAQHVDTVTHARLREVLTCAHADASGMGVLSRAGVARFARVEDADYDPVRAMDREAREVRW